MKRKLAFCLLAVLLSTGMLKAGELEFQLSYGRWTLSPFTTLVERESEDLIRKEMKLFLDPSYPESVYSLHSPRIDLGSSGYFMSLVIWYNFKNSPFSLGLKGQYYNFRMPFDAYLDQTLTILGQEIATAKTRGEGDLELSSFAASILGRWIFLKEKKFQLSVFGGLNFFPYEGSTFLDAQIEIDSPLGDVFFQQSDSLTLDEMREWDDSIPSLLVSPELGLSFQYRFSPKLGVVIDVAIYQGAFISLGMFFDQ